MFDGIWGFWGVLRDLRVFECLEQVFVKDFDNFKMCYYGYYSNVSLSRYSWRLP